MDLPLIGGHRPGASDKAAPQTCVNLYIEPNDGDAYLRSRPGYERYDRFSVTPAAPTDVAQAINSIISTGTNAVIDSNSAVEYGYDIGDVVTIDNSGVAAWNNDWTITAFVPLNLDQTAFVVDNTENGAAPGDDAASTADVIISGGVYNKEIRLFQRYDVAATIGQVALRAVIGNRVYLWEHVAGWAEQTAGAHRFSSMNGPVAGAQMGDTLTDGVVLCDGVSAKLESMDPAILTYTSGAWARSNTRPANTATFMDGYIIRDNIDESGQFVYSDLYDTATENVFSFATAEGAPDDMVAALADRRQLWLFGEYTTEIWYNVGDKDLPFQRSQGGYAEIGCAAPLTAKNFNNSVAWLAQDREGGLFVAKAGDGYQPIALSTPEINTELQKASEMVLNAFALVINWEGHEFYVLTIPGKHGLTDNTGAGTVNPVTFVYDSNSEEWFKWESHNDILAKEDEGRWFPSAHINAYDNPHRILGNTNSKTFGNGHLIGGRDQSGEFYIITPESNIDEHTSGNQVIQCERTIKSITAPNRKRFGLGAVELETDWQRGDGMSASLSYAKDHKAFTTPASRAISAGRLMWKKLGRAYRWTLRFAADTAASTSDSGNHTGLDAAAALTDSGGGWTINQWAGGLVKNTTDGSEGKVTSNTADTVTAALRGGTNNTWASGSGGDAYTISTDSGAVKLLRAISTEPGDD